MAAVIVLYVHGQMARMITMTETDKLFNELAKQKIESQREIIAGLTAKLDKLQGKHSEINSHPIAQYLIEHPNLPPWSKAMAIEGIYDEKFAKIAKMVRKGEVQYVSDHNKNPAGVIIQPELWRELIEAFEEKGE